MIYCLSINNFNAPIVHDTINQNKRIFNGDFTWVYDIGIIKTEVVSIKNKPPVTLNFRELYLKHCDTNQIFSTIL